MHKVYRESHSGADLVNRLLIWEAIEDVKKKRADVLLVRNYDRLARKPQHQAVIVYEVEAKYKGIVESALDQIDRDDPQSKMTRDILAVVAEAERVNAVGRMLRGTRRRAERGHVMASARPLFGYAWKDDVKKKRTTYIEDPETAAIVRRVFDLVLAGRSINAIARLFNKECVPTPAQFAAKNGHIGGGKVGKFWIAPQVHRIVTDRSYTGEATAFRWVREGAREATFRQVKRPEGDETSVKLTYPALISVTIFETAQELLKTKDAVGRPPIDREAAWLRHHVFCGVCGGKMYIERTETSRLKAGERPIYRYRCHKGKAFVGHEEDACPANFTVRANLLDETAYQSLVTLVTNLDAFRELLVQRLGADKIEILARMAESYQVQLTEKREELETARRRARQTKDDELAEQFLRDAERLNTAIHLLEKEYAEGERRTGRLQHWQRVDRRLD